MKSFEEYCQLDEIGITTLRGIQDSASDAADKRAKELYHLAPIKQVYEWVKTGNWNLALFTKWANTYGITK